MDVTEVLRAIDAYTEECDRIYQAAMEYAMEKYLVDKHDDDTHSMDYQHYMHDLDRAITAIKSNYRHSMLDKLVLANLSRA